MTYLAKMMEKDYGIPFERVSYFGIEDTADALYRVARPVQRSGHPEKYGGPGPQRGRAVFIRKSNGIGRNLEGKKAAIYVGGSFKAFSLVKALRHLGIQTAIVGSQTGNREDYEYLEEICDEGTIIVDDTNPLELSRFMSEKTWIS
jgi:nitrogenase molybdenum-cofactor synthesis protein NifE